MKKKRTTASEVGEVDCANFAGGNALDEGSKAVTFDSSLSGESNFASSDGQSTHWAGEPQASPASPTSEKTIGHHLKDIEADIITQVDAGLLHKLAIAVGKSTIADLLRLPIKTQGGWRAP